MTTHQQNLDYVRGKVIAAVPEILKLEFGCDVKVPHGLSQEWPATIIEQIGEKYCVWFWDMENLTGHFYEEEMHIIGRTIRLADILVAMHHHNPRSYFIDIRGDFWGWYNVDVAPIRNEHVGWNPRADDLNLQSEQFVSFLAGIL